MLNLMDAYAASWSLMIIGLIETLAIAYVYGEVCFFLCFYFNSCLHAVYIPAIALMLVYVRFLSVLCSTFSFFKVIEIQT